MSWIFQSSGFLLLIVQLQDNKAFHLNIVVERGEVQGARCKVQVAGAGVGA